MDAVSLPLRRWTCEEYVRMAEAGIIGPDEKVELLDGEVVTMTPQGGPHGWIVEALTELLLYAFGPEFRVRPQLPLRLGKHGMPEPDVALVAGDRRSQPLDHPTRAELVVEVAESTLGKDRLRKGPLYARAGIPEYWIVDLTTDAVEVCRDPGEQGYRSIERLGRGETIRPLAKPDIVLAVADMLPPA